MNLHEVLEAAKKGAGCTTDMALAARLGITRAAVSNWRHNLNTPDAVTSEKLAVLSGLPLHRVLGIVGEARAISVAEKRVWRKLAAAIFVSLLVLPYPVLATVFRTNGHAERHVGVCIMRSTTGPDEAPEPAKTATVSGLRLALS